MGTYEDVTLSGDTLTLDFEPEHAPNTTFVNLYRLLFRKGSDRPVARRKVANNTWIYRGVSGFGAPAIVVQLHKTYVVVHTADTITLNTGGWSTVTTKDRMNTYTPRGVYVFTERGHWKVRTQVGDFDFFDGMLLHHIADDVWAPEPRDDYVVAEQTKHNLNVRRRIEHWIRNMPIYGDDADDYTRNEWWERNTDRFPVGGCVSCTPVGRPSQMAQWVRMTIADEFDNHGHLYEHMLNGEYPMALINLAMNEARRYNPGMAPWQHATDNDYINYLHRVQRALGKYAERRLLTGVRTRSGFARPCAE